MRRLFIIAVVALLGLAPVGGFVVFAQESADPAYWNGVSRPEPIADRAPLEDFVGETQGRSIADRLPQGYRVNFTVNPDDPANRPQIPELGNAEYMIVIVESGEFVLNVLQPPSFVVDPPEGMSVHYVDAVGERDTGYEYTVTDDVLLDENGAPCMDLCTVLPPPTEEPAADNWVAVQLTEGYRAEGPAKNFCLWCLINGEGSLLVYPLVGNDGEFSWVTAYDAAHDVASSEASEFGQGDSALSATTGGRIAWAFNPGSSCK
jgi:hypothetical protein